MLVSLFNANGLSGKRDIVAEFQQSHNIDLMCIVETHFTPNSSTGNPIFSATKTSCTFKQGGHKAKGGLAGYLHHKHDPAKVSHKFMDVDSNYTIIEMQGVVFGIGYFPPRTQESPPELEQKLYDLIDLSLIYADGGPCVIMGDFNARMGETSGDHTYNRRGRILADYLATNQHLALQIPDQGLYTSFGGGSNAGCGVTDIVICGGGISVSDFVVHEDNTLGGSDHRPLVFSVPIPVATDDEARTFERYNVRKFIKDGVIDLYTLAFDADVEHVVNFLEQADVTIDECWDTVKGWIDTAARKSCGMFRYARMPKFNADFFTLDLKNLQTQVQEKENVVGLLRRNRTTPRVVLSAAAAELKELNTALSTLMTSRRRELFHDHVDNLSHPQQAASFLRMAKGAKASKDKTGCQLDPTKMVEHEQHFKKTFGADLQDLPGEPPPPPVFQGVADRQVSLDLIEILFKKLKLGKAPGCDGINGEFYAYGGESMQLVMAKLLTRAMSSSSIPKEWCVAHIVPIFKGKGDITKMENYRPIALTPVARRILEQVLIRDLERETSCLQDVQGGFRKRRSTLDQAFCLNEIMVSNPSTHVILLDFKAAYDTVDRRLLWQKLRDEFHVPEPMIYMLSVLFDYNSSTILVKNTKSSPIPNTQGLLQGSSLSPLLFNLFIDSLAVRLAAPDMEKVTTAGIRANMLLFADDAVVFARALEAAQALLAACEQWAKDNNMRFAPAKCVHIAPTTDPPDDDEDAEPITENLQLYGIPIQRQESAKYLGMYFNEFGIDFLKSTKERCIKANGVAKLLGEVGMNGNGWVYASSTLAYKMFVRSVIEYGIALKPLGKDELELLEKCQASALRRILGAPTNTSIGAMHKVLLVEPIKHRNLVLNAQFTARLHNNNDASIPAVRLWRAKVALGEQKHGKGSRLNPTSRNREFESLVNKGVYYNPLWSKAKHANHVLVPLRHPRVPFGLNDEERARIRMPVEMVAKAFSASQKKVMGRLALIEFGSKKVCGSVSGAIELDMVEGYRAICLPNPDIPRTDRIVMMRWLLGLVCQHQVCAQCGQDLSREHGLECARVREWVENYLLEDMPEAFADRAGADPSSTWLDSVLHALRHDHQGWVNEGISQGIQLCLLRCRQLEQRANGYWGPKVDANGVSEEQRARWVPAPNASQNNLNYTQIQNPAQSAARAANARLRNRQPGRPTANNRHRLRPTAYVPQELRHLPTNQRRPDAVETSEEKDDNTGDPTGSQNSQETTSFASQDGSTHTLSEYQSLPFSSTEVFNGGLERVSASCPDFFEDEDEMINWALSQDGVG